jgi:hypothetical protein
LYEDSNAYGELIASFFSVSLLVAADHEEKEVYCDCDPLGHAAGQTGTWLLTAEKNVLSSCLG